MLAERNSSSPSLTRRLSLGSRISALGTKLTRTLSPSERGRGQDREEGSDGRSGEEEYDSVAPVLMYSEF
ncbi:hypothetical protein GALMADRAFT_254097 [Galerina marginata CBS 339.88]|uniref:Uncharacterized protein n=1 Tax=Galerina marginata (strain CBS 339.88) TaxID=685588 RepID=A0A067SK66_GALM3|nr:hypothetical protein GALMADRAFT_254097 [Galerina marginata CBS 339.88]